MLQMVTASAASLAVAACFSLSAVSVRTILRLWSGQTGLWHPLCRWPWLSRHLSKPELEQGSCQDETKDWCSVLCVAEQVSEQGCCCLRNPSCYGRGTGLERSRLWPGQDTSCAPISNRAPLLGVRSPALGEQTLLQLLNPTQLFLGKRLQTESAA